MGRSCRSRMAFDLQNDAVRQGSKEPLPDHRISEFCARANLTARFPIDCDLAKAAGRRRGSKFFCVAIKERAKETFELGCAKSTLMIDLHFSRRLAPGCDGNSNRTCTSAFDLSIRVVGASGF